MRCRFARRIVRYVGVIPSSLKMKGLSNFFMKRQAFIILCQLLRLGVYLRFPSVRRTMGAGFEPTPHQSDEDQSPNPLKSAAPKHLSQTSADVRYALLQHRLSRMLSTSQELLSSLEMNADPRNPFDVPQDASATRATHLTPLAYSFLLARCLLLLSTERSRQGSTRTLRTPNT